MRATHPTLVAAARAITAQRNTMLKRWSDWLAERSTGSRAIPPEFLDHQLGLIVDVLHAMVGPMRREVRPLWRRVTEHYGRLAATRGLAAGEVVEEMQYLRELLIRYLAPAIAAMRPRQGMALFLRLNRIVDQGVTMAVVGYTDALVTSLMPGDDDPPAAHFDDAATRAEFEGIASELLTIMTPAKR